MSVKNPCGVIIVYAAAGSVGCVFVSVRGQGAFEYLLLLGGIVLVASIVMIIVQGSVGEVNSALGDTSNDYLSAATNRGDNLQEEYLLRYKTPAGCAYSNPACAGGQACNATLNSCGAPANTTANGCAYENPSCPAGYACTASNACIPS